MFNTRKGKSFFQTLMLTKCNAYVLHQGIAIFALMFTYYLWIKAVKTGSIYWGSLTAISYFYMVSQRI